MDDINHNDARLEMVQGELSNLVERRRQLEDQVTEEERRLAPLIDENGVTVTKDDIENLQWYVYHM